MGSFAVQLIKGVSIIVIFLSLSDERVLVDKIAGTEHPNPIRRGTKLLPERPSFLSSLSITKATLAIYPVSSRRERRVSSVCSLSFLSASISVLVLVIIICNLSGFRNGRCCWLLLPVGALHSLNTACKCLPIRLVLRGTEDLST